jgi:hypothetical protein
VLRLQFVDHDARLLVASASIDERDEAPPEPHGLSVSVWDLASKALVNDLEIDGTSFATAASLQVGFSAQTGALFRVDERRGELVQLAPGVCGEAPRPRAPVGDDLGASFVVDPYGRWFASARPLDAARDAAELAAGARSVLVVQDMATGRELQRVTSRYALAGIVATPDGATLFALATQPVEPETGDPVAGLPAVPDGEQVLLDADGVAQNLLVVDVDSNGRRVRQFGMAEAAYGDGHGTFELDASGRRQQPPAPCHDARDTPIAIGYDWRAGPFGSQRAVTCGPLPGMARLVWWSGATIAPRADSSAPTPRAPAAIDGAIAVVADEQLLHVVNLALQREIAQIDLAAATDARAWVLAAKRLVLVEATAADGQRWLRAYALP